MARQVDTAKRVELAEAAYAFLRQQGWRQVSMAELARALGMKRSTLYWYFPDLGAVFEAVLLARFDAQDRYVGERLAGATHPLDLLYRHLGAVHAFYAGREEEIVFLFQFWAVGSPGEAQRAMSALRERFMPRREAAVAMVQAGIDAGLVAPCDPAALVSLIGAMTDGLLIQRLLSGTPLDAVHELIWESLLKPLKLEPKTTEQRA